MMGNQWVTWIVVGAVVEWWWGCMGSGGVGGGECVGKSLKSGVKLTDRFYISLS